MCIITTNSPALFAQLPVEFWAFHALDSTTTSTYLCRSRSSRLQGGFSQNFWTKLAGQEFELLKDEFGRSITFLGTLLGLEGSLQRARLRVHLGELRRASLIRNLTAALEEDALTRDDAKILAGKLEAASATLYGRLGRGFTHSIFRRAYAISPHCALNERLRRSLGWWKTTLETCRCERIVPLGRARPRVMLYTDATPTRAGLFLVDGEKLHQAAWELHEPGATIQYCETLALLQALENYPDFFRGAELILFNDNEGAQASICKGWSTDPENQGLIERTWRQLLELDCKVWIERVPSKGNPADLPSRGQFWNRFPHPITGRKEKVNILPATSEAGAAA